MKKYLFGMMAIALAISLSAFKEIKSSAFTTYYFKNTGTKTSPIWVYFGTSAPTNCESTQANYCYGSTAVPPNGDGSPATTVTDLQLGQYPAL